MSGSGKAWYKRYPRDLFSRSHELTLQEYGAFSLVLDLIHDRGRPVANDSAWLGRLGGCPSRVWNTVLRGLVAKGFLSITADNCIVNHRAMRDLAADGYLGQPDRPLMELPPEPVAAAPKPSNGDLNPIYAPSNRNLLETIAADINDLAFDSRAQGSELRTQNKEVRHSASAECPAAPAPTVPGTRPKLVIAASTSEVEVPPACRPAPPQRTLALMQVNDGGRVGAVDPDVAPHSTATPKPVRPLRHPFDLNFEQREAVYAWQSLARDFELKDVLLVRDKRLQALNARMAQLGGLDGWLALIQTLRGSPGALGLGPNQWKMTFDHLLKEVTVVKVLEGHYVELHPRRGQVTQDKYGWQIEEARQARAGGGS